jgi:bifunctional non-homologous end joining protein LigD
VIVGKKRFGPYTVETTNTDKIFFPGKGLTKGDLVEYYEKIAGAMLPHLKGRPLSMHRFPDGIEGKDFFQQEAPDYFPDWIETVTVRKEEGEITHVICRNAATLVYLADQACVACHVWLGTADRIDRPDRIVVDLDPPGDDFTPVRKIALLLRDLIEELGLTPFVTTTGSRGLHVTVPLDRSSGFDEAREFAQGLAKLAEKRKPGEATTAQRKEKRGGKVFLDTNRNAYAQTAVAPYSVRAKPGAPVAAPLDWDEVADSGLSPQKYHIGNIFRRLSRKGDPWKGLQRHAKSLKMPRQKLLSRLEDG